MLTLQLFCAFFVLCAIGVVAGFVVAERWTSSVLAVIGSLSALAILFVSALLLIGGISFHAELWPVLSLGTMKLAGDRLSAVFLFVTGLVFLPVSIFSGIYLEQHRAHYSLKYFGVLYIMRCLRRSF